MNPENNPDRPGSSFSSNPRFQHRSDDQLTPENISPEEIKLYKDCVGKLYLTAGVPFALAIDIISTVWRRTRAATIPTDPRKLLIKRSVIFFGNIIAGSILGSPYCYQKLVDFHKERVKSQGDFRGTSPATFDSGAPSPQAKSEDFSYQTDLVTNIIDSDASFSSDFTPTILLDDEEKTKKPTMTYQDLRAQNRSKFGTVPNERPQGLILPSQPSETRTSVSEPPPRIVKKNKYGDEME